MTGYYALFAMMRSSLDNNGSSTISPRSGPKRPNTEPKRAKASQVSIDRHAASP
jgi:hypothetical protein